MTFGLREDGGDGEAELLLFVVVVVVVVVEVGGVRDNDLSSMHQTV